MEPATLLMALAASSCSVPIVRMILKAVNLWQELRAVDRAVCSVDLFDEKSVKIHLQLSGTALQSGELEGAIQVIQQVVNGTIQLDIVSSTPHAEASHDSSAAKAVTDKGER
jgi:hypothetical protein